MSELTRRCRPPRSADRDRLTTKFEYANTNYVVLAEMQTPGTDGYGLGREVLTNNVALQPTALSDQLTADW